MLRTYLQLEIYELVILSELRRTLTLSLRRGTGTEEESKDRENAYRHHADSGSFLVAACANIFAVRDGYDYKFWVYILVSNSGTLYIGVTGYIDRRISQHKMDSIEGFTQKYKIHRLVYYETYQYVQSAISREKQLKGWRREKKIALIEKTNPRWQDLSENWGREMRFRGQPLERTP